MCWWLLLLPPIVRHNCATVNIYIEKKFDAHLRVIACCWAVFYLQFHFDFVASHTTQDLPEILVQQIRCVAKFFYLIKSLQILEAFVGQRWTSDWCVCNADAFGHVSEYGGSLPGTRLKSWSTSNEPMTTTLFFLFVLGMAVKCVSPEYAIGLINNGMRCILGKRWFELFIQCSIFYHQFVILCMQWWEIGFQRRQCFHQFIDVILNVGFFLSIDIV